MTVVVTGSYPNTVRYLTGLNSLDLALSNPVLKVWGAPHRIGWEVYGKPEAGKTSLTLYLAGRVYPEGEIELLALDTMDRHYVQSAVEMSGFSGQVHIADFVNQDGSERTTSEMMKASVLRLQEDQVTSLILDNVGMVRPTVEIEADEDYDEAFMGARARLMAKFARDTVDTIHRVEKPKSFFILNHVYTSLGKVPVPVSPGGDSFKHEVRVRLHIWRKEELGGAILVGGKTTKHTYGGLGREFRFVIVAGRGVHPGLSALFDGVEEGVIEAGTTMKLKGKSLGYKSKLVQAAVDGKDEVFDPVLKAVHAHYKGLVGGE